VKHCVKSASLTQLNTSKHPSSFCDCAFILIQKIVPANRRKEGRKGNEKTAQRMDSNRQHRGYEPLELPLFGTTCSMLQFHTSISPFVLNAHLPLFNDQSDVFSLQSRHLTPISFFSLFIVMGTRAEFPHQQSDNTETRILCYHWMKQGGNVHKNGIAMIISPFRCLPKEFGPRITSPENGCLRNSIVESNPHSISQ
jgi:hypothetical protein